DAATIHVVDRGGVAAGLPSRTDTDPRLIGTKHRVAYEREVTVAKGRRDGRTLVIVPELKGNQATGLSLLHVDFRPRPAPDDERAYAFRHHDPAPRLAARFGAKEAVMKALGVGLGAFKLRDVEVMRKRGGAPVVALHGKAAVLADERGVTAWHLSLTHTDSMA